MEIEKKYLMKELPKELDSFQKKVIEQGYLCVNPVVRIRRSNERFILTYKSKLGLDVPDDTADVRINREVEVPLNAEGYEHLKAKVDGYLIEKVRYLIPLPDGHMGELDVFHGKLEGLVFIEVEFHDEADAMAFQPPVWFGENVSSDYRYSNSFLSTCEGLEAFGDKF